MNVQQLLEDLADRVGSKASVRSVYGDPVTVGDRIVIPAAQVRYGFGFGGGKRKGDDAPGGGGGGRVSLRPCGALEISPGGARFIRFEGRGAQGIALALGFVLGAALAALAGPRKIEVVKR